MSKIFWIFLKNILMFIPLSTIRWPIQWTKKIGNQGVSNQEQLACILGKGSWGSVSLVAPDFWSISDVSVLIIWFQLDDILKRWVTLALHCFGSRWKKAGSEVVKQKALDHLDTENTIKLDWRMCCYHDVLLESISIDRKVFQHLTSFSTFFSSRSLCCETPSADLFHNNAGDFIRSARRSENLVEKLVATTPRWKDRHVPIEMYQTSELMTWTWKQKSLKEPYIIYEHYLVYHLISWPIFNFHRLHCWLWDQFRPLWRSPLGHLTRTSSRQLSWVCWTLGFAMVHGRTVPTRPT